MTTNRSDGFSDEDLKRLKEEFDELEKHDPHAMLLGSKFLPGMRALLCRLEAAEKVIQYGTPLITDDLQSVEYTAGISDEYDMALEDWRKSKGASNG